MDLPESEPSEQPPAEVAATEPASPPAESGLPRSLVLLLVAHKLLLVLTTIGVGLAAPELFHKVLHDRNFHYPAGAADFWSRFSTWDGNFYLSIAATGYHAGSSDPMFYPLFPGLIRLFGLVPGRPQLAVAVALGAVLSTLAGLLFFATVRRLAGARVAWLSTAFFVAWPGGYVQGLPYSEGLFAFLFALCLYAQESGRTLLAGVAAFFMPLSRSVGVLMAVPLALRAWVTRGERKLLPWLVPLLPALGFGAYLLVMKLMTGSATTGLKAGERFIFKPSMGRVFDIPGVLKAFVDVKGLHPYMGSLVDRLFFLVTLTGLWLLRRRLVWLAAGAGLAYVSAAALHFSGYIRYSAVLLPVFFAWGEWFAAPGRERAAASVLGISLAMQLFFLIRHTNNYWVA